MQRPIKVTSKTYKRSAFGALEPDVAEADDESPSEKKKKRQVKFQDKVQVLLFKKKQALRKLLGSRKENIPLYEGESEYKKKRRNTKKGANRSPPREGVRMVLEGQRDIEAQFWAAFCRQVWACYGCSHS